MAAPLRRQSTVIRIEEDYTLTVTPDKVHGRPSRHTVFVVENHSDSKVKVRIPPGSFEPDPPKGKKAGKTNPKNPMKPLQIQEKSVDAGDTAVMRLKVRPKDDFEDGDWTYKYSVFWKFQGEKEEELDPQIEINN